MKTLQNRGIYNAILKDFGAAGDGLAGVMDDGVGVVLDGASEVVLVADLHRFVDGGPEPGHFLGSQTGNRRKRK